MTLRLLLLRHAKSDWGEPTLADHDRPLAPRGRRDAPRMGRWLAERGLAPAAAVSSTAARARETARLVLRAAGASPDGLRLDPGLYGAGPSEILRVAAAAPGGSPLLIVGHNPGMELLVGGLDRSEVDRAPGRKPFPTCALAVVRVEAVTWSELPDAPRTLEALIRPRELEG